MMNENSSFSSVRSRFDRQLHHLNDLQTKTGNLCMQMAEDTNRILEGILLPPHGGMEDLEKQVCRQVQEMDRLSLFLVVHEQPVAGDLRRIAICSRIGIEFGRIAHLYTDLYSVLHKFEIIPCRSQLLEMSSLCSRQFACAFRAVSKQSLCLAAQAEQLDDAVDSCYEALKNQLAEQKFDRALGTEVLMAAKYLERIADHCVQIARSLKNTLNLTT